MAEDMIKLKLPSFKKLKKNPWTISTIIFGVIAVAALAVIAANYFQGNSAGFCGIGESSNSAAWKVGQDLVSFLNTNTNSTVRLNNVTEFSGIYEVDIIYQNQTIPLYSTKDGKYLLQTVLPVR